MKLQKLLRHAVLISAVLISATAYLGCSSNEAEKPGWYNAPLLREVFGDYDSTERFFISDPQELARLRARGEYLAQNVSACGSCHAAEPRKSSGAFVGGQLLSDSFGEVAAANITPDPETGIGKWNAAEVMRAIRASIDSEGRPLSIDTHRAYRWMSDQDAKAIAVFLLSREPVKNAVPRRKLGGFERNRLGIFPEHSDFAGYVPVVRAPGEGDNGSEATYDARWGKYLASNVAQCITCHTREGGSFGSSTPFAGSASLATPGSVWSTKTWKTLFNAWKQNSNDGSQELLSPEAQAEIAARNTEEAVLPADELRAAGNFPILGPDIRGSSPTGLREWSTEDIANYLTTGKSLSDQRVRDSALCPWNSYAGMTEVDKRSIAAFLKQL